MKKYTDRYQDARANARVSPNLAAVTLAPEELERICQEYLAKCKEVGRAPTKPGLALAIGVLPQTLDKWSKQEDPRHRAYMESIQKAYATMSDELQQRKDAMSIFLLKQSFYGGYTDKDTSGMPDNITVNVVFGKDKKPTKSTK